MANPTSRSTLQEFCLRRLGKGVIDINVSTDQIDDRTDEALQFFQEYHFDGVEKTYLKHKVTATTLTVSNSAVFTLKEKITGGTSGATAFIFDAPTSTTIRIFKELDDFQLNETITGASSSASQTVTAITAGDIKNGYVPVIDAITGVVKVFPFTNRSNMDMFDVRYQLRLNEVFDLANTSVLYYNMVQRHLSLIDDMLVGEKPIRFNRHSDRIYIDMDWNEDIEADEYLVFEVYRILDPSTYADVYNDMFLKRYLTALLKEQWGQNLSKFAGVQMPGGVTLDGPRILQEAREEIQKIEEEISLRYELPVNMMVG
tara:strand:+ start:268 stop:1212 length:945 start_codon:yes stop_codon:yes gene_type:complete